MRFLSIAFGWIAVGFAAFAQSDRGTATGTISDPAGAVVAGAAVEARNVATGAVYPAASSATGNYNIGQLPAGTYDITVTVAGFKKFVRTGLTVLVCVVVRIWIAEGSLVLQSQAGGADNLRQPVQRVGAAAVGDLGRYPLASWTEAGRERRSSRRRAQNANTRYKAHKYSSVPAICQDAHQPI